MSNNALDKVEKHGARSRRERQSSSQVRKPPSPPPQDHHVAQDQPHRSEPEQVNYHEPDRRPSLAQRSSSFSPTTALELPSHIRSQSSLAPPPDYIPSSTMALERSRSKSASRKTRNRSSSGTFSMVDSAGHINPTTPTLDQSTRLEDTDYDDQSQQPTFVDNLPRKRKKALANTRKHKASTGNASAGKKAQLGRVTEESPSSEEVEDCAANEQLRNELHAATQSSPSSSKAPLPNSPKKAPPSPPPSASQSWRALLEASVRSRLRRASLWGLTAVGILLGMSLFLVWLLEILISNLQSWQLSLIELPARFICGIPFLGIPMLCSLLCGGTHTSLLVHAICNAKPTTEFPHIIHDVNNGITDILEKNNVLYSHNMAQNIFAFHENMHDFRGQLYIQLRSHDAQDESPCLNLTDAVLKTEASLNITRELPLEFQSFLTDMGSTAFAAISQQQYMFYHIQRIRKRTPINDIVSKFLITFYGVNSEEEEIRTYFDHHVSVLQPLVAESHAASVHLQSELKALAAITRDLKLTLDNGRNTCAVSKASILSDFPMIIRMLSQYGVVEPPETVLITENLELFRKMLDWIPEQQKFLNEVVLTLYRVGQNLEKFKAALRDNQYLSYRTKGKESEDEVAVGKALDDAITKIEKSVQDLQGNYERFSIVDSGYRL